MVKMWTIFKKNLFGVPGVEWNGSTSQVKTP